MLRSDHSNRDPDLAQALSPLGRLPLLLTPARYISKYVYSYKTCTKYLYSYKNLFLLDNGLVVTFFLKSQSLRHFLLMIELLTPYFSKPYLLNYSSTNNFFLHFFVVQLNVYRCIVIHAKLPCSL